MLTKLYCNRALSNTDQQVSTNFSHIRAWSFYNPNDEVSFINLYNGATSAVTVGTTAPLLCIPVPAEGVEKVDWTDVMERELLPRFPDGLVIAATKNQTGSTAPDSAMLVNVIYE